MQTLTKRKERIFKCLDAKYRQNKRGANPLFFLLEVESLFPETREVVSFLGEDQDDQRIRAFEAVASRYYPLVGRTLPNCCDCGGTIEQSKDYCVCDTCYGASTAIESAGRLPNRTTSAVFDVGQLIVLAFSGCWCFCWTGVGSLTSFTPSFILAVAFCKKFL